MRKKVDKPAPSYDNGRTQPFFVRFNTAEWGFLFSKTIKNMSLLNQQRA